MHVFLLDRSHVIDIGHVGVKLGLETEIGQYQGEQGNKDSQPFIVLRRECSNPVYQFGLRIVGRPCLYHVRKVKKNEKNGTHKQQGSECAKVPKSGGLEWHKGQKGSHSRYVAHYQWCHYFLDCPPHIRHMGRVHDQVERVVDRYAQYDAGYTDDDDGDIAPEQGHPTHGKEPSPSYGQENQQNIAEGTYGIECQHKYEYDRKRDGNHAVFLYPVRVSDSNLRASDNSSSDLRE